MEAKSSFKLDFGAIRNTKWDCVNPDKEDKVVKIGFYLAIASFIITFFPWFKVTFPEISLFGNGIPMEEQPIKVYGITTWCGLFYFLGAIAMLIGYLYRHYSLAFWGACTSVIFSLLFMDWTPFVTLGSMELPTEFVRLLEQESDAPRFWTIIALLVSAASGVCLYIKIKRDKKALN